MTRPIKKGLKYFPLDTIMEVNIELLEAECNANKIHPLIGFAMYIKLLQEIYQQENGELFLCPNDIAQWHLYRKRWHIKERDIKTILNIMLNIGLFDKERYVKDNVLTSNGIKKRINKIIKERERNRNRHAEFNSTQINNIPTSQVSVKTVENNKERLPFNKSEITTNNDVIPEIENSLIPDVKKKKEVPLREHAIDAKELLKMDFVLRLHDDEFDKFVKEIEQLIIEENKHRTNKFVWDATSKDLRTDLKSLVYKIPDEEKKNILYMAYSINKEKLNWSLYVKECIQIVIRKSMTVAVRKPYNLTLYFIKHPAEVISEMSEGVLAHTIKEILEKAKNKK